MTAFQFQDHTLHLLPEGAVWDSARGWLFVSDLHLGKTAVFRDAGLAVPDGPDQNVLDRLDALVEKTAATELVVLGDVFHARSPGTRHAVELLAGWRLARPALRWHVVPGNHDARVPWNEWLPGAAIIDEGGSMGPWTLSHFPPDLPGATPVLCGHLHPGAVVGPTRGGKVRLPCFWLRRNALVLPAFGDFTGIKIISREPNDRVWVTIRDQVNEVPRLS